MSWTILFPWPGLSGLWAAATLLLVLWWLIAQHRLEQVEHQAMDDLVGDGDGLRQLLDEEASAIRAS
ncbi:hypothetical protein [Methylorubrum aminovorans]|uniref:hypothetical protein n=1 Tax=Methylorubrum aminovorans TaxID=269069 RepID=UPI001EDF6DC0|nr:hypothetical protein [Methylorubrum aminovorans]